MTDEIRLNEGKGQPFTGIHWGERLEDDSSSNAPSSTITFDAFISYSRTADASIAEALQQGMQQFAKPWYRRRRMRVFRDDQNLGASPGLWQSIREALGSSRYFVLLASEAAARSKWVDREVATWAQLNSVDRLLIAITERTVGSDAHEGKAAVTARGAAYRFPAPPTLTRLLRDEPRYVDLSWARSTQRLTLKDARFREAIADLAAPILDTSKDDLLGQDLLQHQRQRRWIRAAVAALTLLTAAAIITTFVAVAQRSAAQAQAARAEARQYAAQSVASTDPYSALTLALAAEHRTRIALPEAVAAYADASQRVSSWIARPITRFGAPSNTGRMLNWTSGMTVAIAATPPSSVAQWRLPHESIAAGVPILPSLVRDEAWLNDHQDMAILTDQSIVVRNIHSGAIMDGPLPCGGLELAVAPDGTTAAVQVVDRLFACDLHTGHVQDFEPLPVHTVWRMSWAPDNRHLALATSDGLWICSIEGGVPIRLNGAGGDLWSVDWSPTGSTIAAGDDHGNVFLWSAETGVLLRPSFASVSGRAAVLRWSADGSWLAIAGDHDVRLFDMTLGTLADPMLSLGSQRHPDALAWSSDGTFLAGQFSTRERTSSANVGNGDIIQVWELSSHGRIASRPLSGPKDSIYAVAWSVDGRLIAAADGTGATYIWDVPSRRELVDSRMTIGFEGNIAMALSWSPRSDALAIVSEDGLRIWRLGSTSAKLWWGSGGAISLSWSPDGRTLAVGTDQGRIQTWDVDAGKRVADEPQHGTAIIRAIAWSPDGKQLASVSDDGFLQFCDAYSVKPQSGPIRLSGLRLRTLSWSTNAHRLAVAGEDGIIYLVDAATPATPVLRIRTADPAVNALAWSKDGSRLASAGSAGSLQFWDESGAPLGSTRVATATQTLAWSPDGGSLVTGDLTGGVSVWQSLKESAACTELDKEMSVLDGDKSGGVAVGLNYCARGPASLSRPPIIPIIIQ